MTQKYRNKYDHHYLLIDIFCQFDNVGKPIKTDDLPDFLDSFYNVMAKRPTIVICHSANGIFRCPNLRKD